MTSALFKDLLVQLSLEDMEPRHPHNMDPLNLHQPLWCHKDLAMLSKTLNATTLTSRSKVMELRLEASQLERFLTFYFPQVTGQYSVLLPDGRVQTVTYSVRPESGFVVSNCSLFLRLPADQKKRVWFFLNNFNKSCSVIMLVFQLFNWNIYRIM